MFCAFLLENAVLATAACSFWTSDLQKVVRPPPQRRAILEHRDFKNCYDRVVFCAFWLESVLCATAACHFSTSELQKLLRPRGVLCILTCKCASRFAPQRRLQKWLRDCVVLCILTCKCAFRATAACHFSSVCWTAISAPAALARLLFEHQKTTNHWENTAIRDFPNIWRMWIFFLVTLLACWPSFCWLDCSTLFSTVHIVGS